MGRQIAGDTSGTGGRIRRRYLGVVCSAVLAVGTVAGIGIRQAGGPKSTARTAETPISVATPSAGADLMALTQPYPQMIYYLVGSEEQAGQLQAELNDHVGDSDPGRSVVVVAAPGGRALSNSVVQAYVIDLRPAPATETP